MKPYGTWFLLALHECQLCGKRVVGVWIDKHIPTDEMFVECTACGRLAKPITTTPVGLLHYMSGGYVPKEAPSTEGTDEDQVAG